MDRTAIARPVRPASASGSRTGTSTGFGYWTVLDAQTAESSASAGQAREVEDESVLSLYYRLAHAAPAGAGQSHGTTMIPALSPAATAR